METKAYIRLTSILSLCIIVTLAWIFTACNASNTVKGGAIGTAAGGAVGAAVGKAANNTAAGAIIGAAVGGTTGALIGRHMDKQAEELRRDLEGAEVERIGEGIKITFDSGLLFDVDSDGLKPATEQNLEELAATLKKYDETNILIEGHTDNTGPDGYNQDLSEDRAESVSGFLLGQNVDSDRITTVGYGESQPVADNNITAGRESNRRVEVAIFANERMKEMAEDGEI